MGERVRVCVCVRERERERGPGFLIALLGSLLAGIAQSIGFASIFAHTYSVR